jgi:chemotaxis protein CheD
MSLPVLATGTRPHIAFLTQGAIHCKPRRSLITTILGSCVAVCLWDQAKRLGGMNHFVLPSASSELPNPRFGDAAIDRLYQAMLRLGCRTDTMTAKLFGGAAVLPFGATGDTIGQQNVQIALSRLQHYGIPITARRTGGVTGLWIRFDTETGEVLLRPVSGNLGGQGRAALEAGRKSRIIR